MKTSIIQQKGISPEVLAVVERLVGRIPWPERRVAMADVTVSLLEGRSRTAEDIFGWGRNAIDVGLQELKTGITCINDLSGRRKPKAEDKNPQLLIDIEEIISPHSQADSHLRTTLAYTNITANSVRQALLQRGWREDQLPGERTFNNILNRHGYRLRTVAKSKPQKKRP